MLRCLRAKRARAAELITRGRRFEERCPRWPSGEHTPEEGVTLGKELGCDIPWFQFINVGNLFQRYRRELDSGGGMSSDGVNAPGAADQKQEHE